MEFGLSTHMFADQRLSSHILDQILQIGIRQIELFAARQHVDYHDRSHVRDIAQWFSDHGVSLHSVHAPMFSDFDWGKSGGLVISISYLERRLRIDSMDEIKRAAELAERLPFRYLVLHMGLEEEEFSMEKLDAAFTSLEHLKVFAKERGVEVLLENIPNQLSTPERLVQFVEHTHMNDVKFCFDSGHAHLAGGVQPAFETMKSRLASTHVHDNRGEEDDHLLPFEGTIKWDEAVGDLRAMDNVPVLFELNYGPESPPLERVQEVMRKLEDLSWQKP